MPGLVGLADRHDRQCEQRSDDGKPERDRNPVPPQRTAQPLNGALLPHEHGLAAQVTAQVIGELRCGLVAIHRIMRGGAPDDALQFRPLQAAEHRELHRHGAARRVQLLGNRRTHESAQGFACDQLVEHRAEREDVCAHIRQARWIECLRRDVAHRALEP